jgi:hypothetical protein
MTTRLRSITRMITVGAATIVALRAIWALGDIFVFSYSLLWGPWMLVAMRSGMNSAPKENWTRPIGWPQSVMVHGVLASIIGAPAVLTGFWYGSLAAAASVWLILVTMGLSERLLNEWFGSVSHLHIDEPSSAPEPR